MDAERIDDPRSGEKANDKPDNGEFLRFHTKLLETLAWETYLTPVQIRIVLHVVRMTWGWNRKFFIFKQAEVAERLGIDRGNLSRAFNALIKADVLMTQKGEVGVNKYVEQWNLEHLDQTKRKPVGKKPTSCEITNSELVKNQQDVVKLPTSSDRSSAQSADLSDPYRHSLIDKHIDNPPISPKGSRKGVSEIDPVFLEAWKKYPQRTGTNSVTEAWSAFKARLAEGISSEAMLEAIPKYRAWCEATGRVGTEYVMQGGSFFGPKKRGWEGNWTLPGQVQQATPRPEAVQYARLQRRAP